MYNFPKPCAFVLKAGHPVTGCVIPGAAGYVVLMTGYVILAVSPSFF
jgi:hypothetical protein